MKKEQHGGGFGHVEPSSKKKGICVEREGEGATADLAGGTGRPAGWLVSDVDE